MPKNHTMIGPGFFIFKINREHNQAHGGNVKEMKKRSLQPIDGEHFNKGTISPKQSAKGDLMNNFRKASMQIIFALALIAAPLVAFQLQGTDAQAQSSYFTSQGCSGCHSAPVVATCNGCHAHGTHPSSAKSSIN